MHMNFEASAPAADLISFEDFLKVDVRIGEIIHVEDIPAARKPSYKLKIDFGPGVGVKKSAAQIVHHYTKAQLLHKKIAAVVNFPPRQIGPVKSEVLVLGFADKDQNVVLFSLDQDVPKGSRLH